MTPPNISIAPKNVKQSQGRWEVPEDGWIKLNFDGAAKGNPRETIYGCIARDGSRKVIFSIADYLDISTNNEVEAMALERGMKHCV